MHFDFDFYLDAVAERAAITLRSNVVMELNIRSEAKLDRRSSIQCEQSSISIRFPARTAIYTFSFRVDSAQRLENEPRCFATFFFYFARPPLLLVALNLLLHGGYGGFDVF